MRFRFANHQQNGGNLAIRRLIMLWTVFVVLLVLWLLGFSLHVAGGLIHLLLVVGLVVLVINLLSGRRAVWSLFTSTFTQTEGERFFDPCLSRYTGGGRGFLVCGKDRAGSSGFQSCRTTFSSELCT